MQFTVLDRKFASFYSLSGESYGLYFRNNTQYELESLFKLVIDRQLSSIEREVYETSVVYCIGTSIVQKSNSFIRGAKIIGILAGSLSHYFSFLRPGLCAVLQYLIDDPANIRETIKSLYKHINKAPWPVDSKPEQEKNLLKWCYDKGYTKTTPMVSIKLNIPHMPICIEIDTSLLDEEIIPVSLMPLYLIFGKNITKIYSGVMQEKRILVFSHEKPCWFVCNAACSVARLVSPPVPFVIRQHLFPFVNLNSLDFLNKSFYIAGANNPLFRDRKSWWDVLADLDTGEILSSLDLSGHAEFINKLSGALQCSHNKEIVIRSHFHDYTQSIIDYNTYPLEFQLQVYRSQLQKLRKSTLMGYYNIKHYKDLQTEKDCYDEDVRINLLKLKLSFIKNDPSHIDVLYYNIYNSLTDTPSLVKFLAHLPDSGSLSIVAWAFFTENTKACKHACEILTKIQDIPEGEFLVAALPGPELNAYVAYKHRE